MKSVKYKKQGKKGLFDEQNAIEHMNEMGNPLEKISSVINFEFFRELADSIIIVSINNPKWMGKEIIGINKNDFNQFI